MTSPLRVVDGHDGHNMWQFTREFTSVRSHLVGRPSADVRFRLAVVTVVHICLNNTYHVCYSDRARPYGLTDHLVPLTVHTIAWPNDTTGSLY